MWNNIQDLIPKAAGKYNFAKTLNAINICREYRSLADTYLPKLDGEKIQVSYKDGVLTLKVENSALVQEINMKKHLIQDDLNNKFGPNKIKEIKIRLAQSDSAWQQYILRYTRPALSLKAVFIL